MRWSSSYTTWHTLCFVIGQTSLSASFDCFPTRDLNPLLPHPTPNRQGFQAGAPAIADSSLPSERARRHLVITTSVPLNGRDNPLPPLNIASY